MLQEGDLLHRLSSAGCVPGGVSFRAPVDQLWHKSAAILCAYKPHRKNLASPLVSRCRARHSPLYCRDLF
jgi:hypothetical protein